MVEPKVPLKKKDQVALDEEMARNIEAQLQAKLIEEERLARQKKEEANIALIESCDNTQVMMVADFELAQRLQAEEQGEITIEERSRLFVELMNRRKKHFAKLRAEEIRRKPPTKSQNRNQMSTYLKNMAGYKHNQLKRKSYDEIQKLFDKEMKRVNTFVDMNSEVVKGSETRTEESSKIIGDELESDMSKKQKIDEHVEVEKDDQEEAEMKRHIEIVKDDEGIDREDLDTLWKLVKAKHRNTRPEEDYERVLWGDLKLQLLEGLMLSEMRSKTYQRRDKMSRLKLPVLKIGEYDLWSMRMEQYLTFTDHALWEDAKYLWVAIKNRFGGNKESKKMQKTILKQNYENFAASSQEGLDKTYDRFQKLISQLEIHGEVISQEDANLKLLRSLPSAWNNIALIMRNKSDLDTLSMDDLYNNLKVYESEIKGKSSSSSNSQNVAFVSSDNSSSTNETVNTAHSVSAASSKDQASTASYVDDVMFSFFSNQSNAPQLDYEDLEQIDADDLEEMDLKWQVAMLTMRVKRFIKKTGRKMDLNNKETVGFDKTKIECYNCHRRGHFARECRVPRNQGNRNRDAPRRNALVDTSNTNALVVQDGIGSSSSSSLDSELEEVLKEKDDLKLKLENFEESSKNLTKQIDSQISAKDKTGLGYDSQINKSEVVHSVFNSKESYVDDSLVNDRFKIGEGFHAVPPPYTGNYMPLRPDLSFAGLDDSVYKTKVSETETSISKTSKDIIEKPKTVRPSALIIEE
ncbi:ribonuclease H-like domain-containing protein [Tanacetum coccineum]